MPYKNCISLLHNLRQFTLWLLLIPTLRVFLLHSQSWYKPFGFSCYMAIPDTNPLGFPATWPFLIQTLWVSLLHGHPWYKPFGFSCYMAIPDTNPLGFPATWPFLIQNLWVSLLHGHCIRFYSDNIASLLVIGKESLFRSWMHVCTYYLPWPHTRLSKRCMWHSLTFSDTSCKALVSFFLSLWVWMNCSTCMNNRYSMQRVFFALRGWALLNRQVHISCARGVGGWDSFSHHATQKNSGCVRLGFNPPPCHTKNSGCVRLGFNPPQCHTKQLRVCEAGVQSPTMSHKKLRVCEAGVQSPTMPHKKLGMWEVGVPSPTMPHKTLGVCEAGVQSLTMPHKKLGGVRLGFKPPPCHT